MGKYIKEFNNHTEYEGLTLVTPNVINCSKENHVHYNSYVKHGEDYSNDYLTFEIVKDGTLTWNNEVIDGIGNATAKDIEYSIDNGDNWITITSQVNAEPFLNVIVGQKILFKGNNQRYCSTLSDGNYHYYYASNYFGGTAYFNVYGNIGYMSNNNLTEHIFYRFFHNSNVIDAGNLIFPSTPTSEYCYSEMFKDCYLLEKAPELPSTGVWNYCYKGMFINCYSLIKAPSILPATEIHDGCYQYMFRNCKNLTTSPIISALKLHDYCCQYMFEGCSSLNYIKAMFTTAPREDQTKYWVDGVSPTGTFVKNSAATWNVTGINGIPSGWTVVTADS